ncbi:hypothetical protein [Roseateles violae]|uniref:Uncharacterized protein n=1 Tax=Roseateles violae TaxID=3058042 RepID=A0ABT8DYD4_9BURK|nr:hypothetical protein [Pelomonas sp. PFR6]MDN3922336.1 hypothetical protein [Pelomonas sp. PFR6]
MASPHPAAPASFATRETTVDGTAATLREPLSFAGGAACQRLVLMPAGPCAIREDGRSATLIWFDGGRRCELAISLLDLQALLAGGVLRREAAG